MLAESSSPHGRVDRFWASKLVVIDFCVSLVSRNLASKYVLETDQLGISVFHSPDRHFAYDLNVSAGHCGQFCHGMCVAIVRCSEEQSDQWLEQRHEGSMQHDGGGSQSKDTNKPYPERSPQSRSFLAFWFQTPLA